MYINLEGAKLSQADVSPDDVFMIKMNLNKHGVDVIKSVFDAFKFCFPGNKCLIVPHDCEVSIIKQSEPDLMPATQEELFEFLNINITKECVSDE